MSKTAVVPGSDNAADAEKALAAKGAPGFEVVVAGEDELQIDYDHPFNEKPHYPKRFFEIVEVMRKAGLVRSHARQESKNGRTHIIVRLWHPMSEVERVAWQSCFGSDPLREALNLVAIRNEVKNPILLFMRKDRVIEPVIVDEPKLEDTTGRKFRDE